jgi:hypothetical protein
MNFKLPAGGSSTLKGASVTAEGSYTWCTKQASAEWVDGILTTNLDTKSSRSIHAVAGGQKLLLFSPAGKVAKEHFAEYVNSGEFSF